MFDALAVAALAGFAAALISARRDWGMSWDEPVSAAYGRAVLSFLATGGEDRAALQLTLATRGGTFHALVEGLARAMPLDALEARRIVTGAVAIVGAIGAWRLARGIRGPLAGLLAVLLLTLTPSFVGHACMNPSDLPFATGTIWGLHLALRVTQRAPALPTSDAIAFGVVLGLALGVRFAGISLLVYVAVLYAVRTRYCSTPHEASRAQSKLKRRATVLAASVIAYVLTIALWPAALEQPLRFVWDAVSSETTYPKHELVTFGGQFVWADALPARYWLVHFCSSLPLLLLGLFVAGSLQTFARTRGSSKRRDLQDLTARWLLIVAAWLPLIYATLRRPPDYDGIRHFLFVVPIVACVGGITLADGLTWLAEKRRVALVPVLTVVLASLGLQLRDISKLHPYQYAYYNELVGGLRGAGGRFETDYWALSFKPLTEKFRQHLASVPSRQVAQVFVCGPEPVARHYLGDVVDIVGDPAQADYVISTTKWDCHKRYPGRVVAEVRKQGVLFSVALELPRESG